MGIGNDVWERFINTYNFYNILSNYSFEKILENINFSIITFDYSGLKYFNKQLRC